MTTKPTTFSFWSYVFIYVVMLAISAYVEHMLYGTEIPEAFK